MSKVPLTVTGAEKLRVELHRLKTVERPWVIAAIAEARAHGDLSENAEYDAAKERQGFIEGRIQEVEGKLSNAQIIDPALLDALPDIFPEATGRDIKGLAKLVAKYCSQKQVPPSLEVFRRCSIFRGMDVVGAV